MTKESKIAAELRRQQVVGRYVERHAELKRAPVDPHLSQGERDETMTALHVLSRDASPARLRQRDAVDDHPRGHLRVAGTSWVRFREVTLRGELPDIVKSSWQVDAGGVGPWARTRQGMRRHAAATAPLSAPLSILVHHVSSHTHPPPRSSYASWDPPQLPAHYLS